MEVEHGARSGDLSVEELDEALEAGSAALLHRLIGDAHVVSGLLVLLGQDVAAEQCDLLLLGQARQFPCPPNVSEHGDLGEAVTGVGLRPWHSLVGCVRILALEDYLFIEDAEKKCLHLFERVRAPHSKPSS